MLKYLVSFMLFSAPGFCEPMQEISQLLHKWAIIYTTIENTDEETKCYVQGRLDAYIECLYAIEKTYESIP